MHCLEGYNKIKKYPPGFAPSQFIVVKNFQPKENVFFQTRLSLITASPQYETSTIIVHGTI